MKTIYTKQKVEPAREATKLSNGEATTAVFQYVYKRLPTEEETKRLVIHCHQDPYYGPHEAITLVFNDPPETNSENLPVPVFWKCTCGENNPSTWSFCANCGSPSHLKTQ